MTTLTVTRPDFPTLFGGLGFHNSEALFYRLCEKEQFDQKIGKCYRELSPGFMRTFGGYANWTKESMDTFADYYERMQKVTDTPIYLACAKGQLHFSDEARREYAENVARNLEYLIKERNVRQIRYYCFSNELSMNDNNGLAADLPLFQKYHEYLYEAFDRHDLNIGLLATDASGESNWPTMDYAVQHMKRVTEDFCLHMYMTRFLPGDIDMYPWFFDLCREYVMKAIRCDGKRLILGELGVRHMREEDGQLRMDDFVHLPGVIKDVNAFNYHGDGPLGAIMYAEAALAAINAGVFAISIWTFCDYPDPYVCHYAEHDEYARKWGECERFISQTQDTKYNKCGLIKWEDDGDYSVRESYWCLGLLARYARRNSKVLDIQNDDPLLRTLALLNKDGTLSVFVINRHEDAREIAIDLRLRHIEKQPPLRVYEFEAAHPPVNEFGDLQEPSCTLGHESGRFAYAVKPLSLTVFTTDYVCREDVPAENVRLEDGVLKWDAVHDDQHGYYRVYRGETPDFTPDRTHQIASTIAETLELNARYLDDAAIRTVPGAFYKVLSVGKRR